MSNKDSKNKIKINTSEYSFLEQELNTIKQILNSIKASNLELANKVNKIQEHQNNLSGNISKLYNEIGVLNPQQEDLIEDSDEILSLSNIDKRLIN